MRRLFFDFAMVLVQAMTTRLKKLGRSMGLTRERVRQIESAAIRKLRSPDFAERLRDYVQTR